MEGVNIQELKPIKGLNGCTGCGSLLGLKLLLQTLNNIIIVNGTGSVTPFIEGTVIHAGTNAAAVARGIAHSLNKDDKNKPTVVVYAGDGATSESINALLNSREDIIYVCANDQSYNLLDRKLGKSFSKQLASTASYVATACVSYPDDYIMKLKKASAMKGFKFIDLLCPCPVSWGYETSNTIEVGRVAVETGFWPLYEFENGTVNLTKRPNRLEPLENLSHAQKKIPMAGLQDKINAEWKLLTEGHLL